MTLYEKQQSQRQWQEKLERERRNISASVEETLYVYPNEQWDEHDDEHECPSNGSSKNTTLIPPRLSLQSKMLPALRSGGFVQSATAAHAAYQQEQQRHATTPSNIFARLAQRFTSSFAALNVPQTDGSSVSRTSLPPQSQPSSSEAVSQRHVIPMPPSSIHSTEKPMKVIDAIPATPSTRPIVAVIPPAEPQRLAGRTTRVRLQAASLPSEIPTPAVAQAEPVIDVQQQFESRQVREPVVINMRVRDVSQVSTNPSLPIVPSVETRVENRARMMSKETAYTTCFGTYAFESGQAEVMVAQEQVKDSSVVHIMLTSNPGQTLVQYISLHPQQGFTVHLTAPASTKTSFNYMLFVP